MIILNEENTRLFGEQVNDHISKLNDIMGHGSGESFDANMMKKTCFANKLLEGSTRMLGMDAWSQTLGLFGSLLDRVIKSTGCWDENISQIVSEILETEEQIVAQILTEETEGIDGIDNFEGLRQEIELLLDELYGQSDPEGPEFEEIQQVSIDNPETESVSTGTVISIDSSGIESGKSSFKTLERLLGSLAKVRNRYSEYLTGIDDNPGLVRDLELAFGESEFFLGLVGNILGQLGEHGKIFRAKVSSETVLDGVEDFMEMNSRLRGWDARLSTTSDNFSLERSIASELAVILECCVGDICRMHEGRQEFGIEIKAVIENRGSFLSASISDNGEDFLSDSRIDEDDAVAFYKGLLQVRGLLRKRGCLLWVEPEEGRECRFRFTFPRTSVMTDYHLVEASGITVAVPCRCIDSILDVEDVDIEDRGSGRQVVLDGRIIPVCRLDELAAEEIDRNEVGDHIVLMGQAEKRMGLYFNGTGVKIEAIEEQVTKESQLSITHNTLHIGEQEYPVLDPNLLFERFGIICGYNDSPGESGFYTDGKDDGSAVEDSISRV